LQLREADYKKSPLLISGLTQNKQLFDSAESVKCFGHLFPGFDRIFGLLPEKQSTIECMKDTVKKQCGKTDTSRRLL